MLAKLEELHKICFPHKSWSAVDFSDLKKSGCEIIGSDNGFIVWRVVMDEAEIITIGVRPDFRKTGMAAAMLTIAENEIKKSNVKKIFLEVAENNIPARKLYEKNGYKQIGIRPKYYDGIDAILMEKRL
ncbi:MAG: ribosomal protein S18-alanine N-acetyltransferase [Alphaproteobacteria bacterium]|nr:ribosomal protein S18-alanine N-acetyltransferase [Alphaproteobacteria bacterium]MBN2675194.1 ribosomal protein S18-alanine N-acetyltransferase [Alphaproteobacteria bacterium]